MSTFRGNIETLYSSLIGAGKKGAIDGIRAVLDGEIEEAAFLTGVCSAYGRVVELLGEILEGRDIDVVAERLVKERMDLKERIDREFVADMAQLRVREDKRFPEMSEQEQFAADEYQRDLEEN